MTNSEVRVELYEHGEEPRYVSVTLNGRELGVYQPWKKQESLAEIVKAAYERGRADATAEMQQGIKTLLGIK